MIDIIYTITFDTLGNPSKFVSKSLITLLSSILPRFCSHPSVYITMSSDSTAPKQWQLSKKETLNSFEAWKDNLDYRLSLNTNFTEFLAKDFKWKQECAATPTRGLKADVEPIPEANRKTAAQKNVHLDRMLKQIANFCQVITRSLILKCNSLPEIWVEIRRHYQIEPTGSQFLNLVSITLATDDSHEDLYQRFYSFFEDSLLKTDCLLKHHGDEITTDENLSPTLENTIVLLWLQAIHKGLPELVKQKYGAELRNQTLASIKPEISQALCSLLDDLRSMRTPRFSACKLVPLATIHSMLVPLATLHNRNAGSSNPAFFAKPLVVQHTPATICQSVVFYQRVIAGP